MLAEPKTRQSKRTLPMPRPMVDALRRHRQAQRKARIYAGSEWHESGLVFTTVTGRPIDPRDHSVHWVKFLEGAGVRPARLHEHDTPPRPCCSSRVSTSAWSWTCSAGLHQRRQPGTSTSCPSSSRRRTVG